MMDTGTGQEPRAGVEWGLVLSEPATMVVAHTQDTRALSDQALSDEARHQARIKAQRRAARKRRQRGQRRR